jgi:hypothetical protein
MRGVAPGNTISGVDIHDLRIQGELITDFEEGGFRVNEPVRDVTFHGR